MNEAAQRCEEQIISFFPGMETLVCHGWILKKMERHFCVYPLYYKASDGNIPDNVHRCEEISRQSGRNCVFRIVEHTNYHLSAILADNGYALWKCGAVCELSLAEFQSCFGRERRSGLFLKKGAEEKRQSGLFLRKGAGKETVEYVLSGDDTVVGIKRQELLLLPDGNLPDNVDLEDVLRFSLINGVTKILADIPAKEEVSEQYMRAGFNRVYLYRCYRKQEEKSSKEQEN